jgi:AsmA protein
MKRLLIGLVVVVALVIAVLVAAPFFIPVETYKQQIAEHTREATGRELTIGGELSLSLLPRLELQAGDVAFANAPGASQADMAALKQLVLRLQVLPLLSGEIKVDSFVLVEPVIHLEVDKKGRPNWQFAGAPAAEAEAAETRDQDQGVGAGGLAELSLGDVRLEKGLVTYSDAQSGQAVELSDINMKVSLPDLDTPFAAEGSLVWNGEEVSLKAGGDNRRGGARRRQGRSRRSLDPGAGGLDGQPDRSPRDRPRTAQDQGPGQRHRPEGRLFRGRDRARQHDGDGRPRGR